MGRRGRGRRGRRRGGRRAGGERRPWGHPPRRAHACPPTHPRAAGAVRLLLPAAGRRGWGRCGCQRRGCRRGFQRPHPPPAAPRLSDGGPPHRGSVHGAWPPWGGAGLIPRHPMAALHRGMRTVASVASGRPLPCRRLRPTRRVLGATAPRRRHQRGGPLHRPAGRGRRRGGGCRRIPRRGGACRRSCFWQGGGAAHRHAGGAAAVCSVAGRAHCAERRVAAPAATVEQV